MRDPHNPRRRSVTKKGCGDIKGGAMLGAGSNRERLAHRHRGGFNRERPKAQGQSLKWRGGAEFIGGR